MTERVQNNKRILKNTIYLYLRMIVTTVVSLYTARVTLVLLGDENFGIFNVVGGIIGFTGMFTATMAIATHRYLSYDIGTGNVEKFNKTFSMLVNIYAAFCVITIVVFEIIGPFFIHTYLNIPSDRVYAAQWIFQFTIISFALSTILVPYTSAIVAYEKMGVYAYLTFIDVIFKLAVVLCLYITPYDKLITYGLLTCLMSIVCNIIYYLYCVNKLAGCSYRKYWDKSLFKEMASYSGWNLLGTTSGVLTTQGLSLMLNIFFGPIVNAAKAIADRVSQTVVSFCTNFYMAVNPQIIKTYAAGEITGMRRLVIWSSKFSFFLLSILSIPLLMNMGLILNLWLGKAQVTHEMIQFSVWSLIYAMINVLENPISQVIRATGKLKKYQLTIGIQTILFLPICFLLFKLGFSAYVSMIILSIVYFIVQFSRVHIAAPIIKLPTNQYIKTVILPIVLTSVGSIICIYTYRKFCHYEEGLTILILYLIFDFVIVCLFILMLGLNSVERQMVWHLIISKLKR